MGKEIRVGQAADIPPGTVVGAGPWAVGNVNGDAFYMALTKVLPLARGAVEVRDGVVYVR